MDSAKGLPIWRADCVVLMFLLHMGPVEFLYYWLHPALHHIFLYSRCHSHHHSSIVTEPITCMCTLVSVVHRTSSPSLQKMSLFRMGLPTSSVSVSFSLRHFKVSVDRSLHFFIFIGA